MDEDTSTDRDRALEMARNFVPGPLNLRPDRIADLLLEFAATEAEHAKLDCTCAAFWASYGKIDPTCAAHDLEYQQKERAAELRAQKS